MIKKELEQQPQRIKLIASKSILTKVLTYFLSVIYLLNHVTNHKQVVKHIMKNPPKQNQHKLPQVYMREFGYDYKGQKKVSVLKIGEKFIRQKSIESFLSETNIFKIKSENGYNGAC